MNSLESTGSGGANLPVATPGTELEAFETGLHSMLASIGLPIEKLFVPLSERAAMINNVPGVLAELDQPVLARSHYVSEMMAAATVGLFDAALNYLWDELVSELRARVVGFDLSYFFDIAAGNNADLRKALKSADDLPKIDDAHLLRAVLNIGLITDVGYQRLDHMRNNASAAHPERGQPDGPRARHLPADVRPRGHQCPTGHGDCSHRPPARQHQEGPARPIKRRRGGCLLQPAAAGPRGHPRERPVRPLHGV